MASSKKAATRIVAEEVSPPWNVLAIFLHTRPHSLGNESLTTVPVAEFPEHKPDRSGVRAVNQRDELSFARWLSLHRYLWSSSSQGFGHSYRSNRSGGRAYSMRLGQRDYRWLRLDRVHKTAP